MQIAMSKKKGRLLIFGREGRVEKRNRNSAWRDMCTSLLSASEVREKSSHSGRTFEERVEEETLLLPDGVKHPSESAC